MRLILCISTLLVTGTISAFASVDPDLLALVPPGARLISGIQLDQARSSAFGQYVLTRIDTENQDFQRFIETTGFDPRRDLDEFVFAATAPASDNSQPGFAILARGTFDQDRLKAKAKSTGAEVQKYQGVDLIFEKNAHHNQTGFAFLEGGIAVMADRATLRQIVAARASPTEIDPALQQQVLEVSANNDAWFASLSVPPHLAFAFPGEVKQGEGKQEAKQQDARRAEALQSILQSSGGIHFGDTVTLSFNAQTRSDKDAISLEDVVRFVSSMIQMQRQNDPRAAILASALDNMQMTTNGPALHVSVSLPEKNLEQLAEAHPKAKHEVHR